MRFRPSEKDGTHKCPKCAAHYDVSYDKATPAKEEGTAICSDCKKPMGEWNSTREPLFGLIGK